MEKFCQMFNRIPEIVSETKYLYAKFVGCRPTVFHNFSHLTKTGSTENFFWTNI